MTENKRYKLNGDTFIDTLNEKVLIGYQGIIDELNTLHDENNNLKQTIKKAYETEKTQLGKSTLKQLMEAIQ